MSGWQVFAALAVVATAWFIAGVRVGCDYTRKHYDGAADKVIEYIAKGETGGASATWPAFAADTDRPGIWKADGRTIDWCESCESRPAQFAVDLGTGADFKVCDRCSEHVIAGRRRPLNGAGQ